MEKESFWNLNVKNYCNNLPNILCMLYVFNSLYIKKHFLIIILVTF